MNWKNRFDEIKVFILSIRIKEWFNVAMLNLSTEQFCQELSIGGKCHISVRLDKQSQRNRKSCYRRRGELFSFYPLHTLTEEYIPLLLIDCNSDWPKITQFRLNLDPFETFKNENDSKKSLWDFLGSLYIYDCFFII